MIKLTNTRLTISGLFVVTIMLLAVGCDRREPAATKAAAPPPVAVKAPPTETPAPAEDAAPNDAETNAPADQTEAEWIEPAERIEAYLDFAATDQDGNPLMISDLIGKPTAITFIYTRCPMPKMCPLITTTMAKLQRLAVNEAIDADVQFLLISYDPHYDTPQRLKKYALDRGVRLDNAKLLRPASEDTAELLGELDIGVIPQADGTIGHFIELVMIDHQGQIARNRRGAIWDNSSAIKDLKTLVAQMHAAADSPAADAQIR